jgi:DNA-directed RNA polymerase alpha subunit
MTLGDIVKLERKDFLRLKNLGKKSVSELIDVLEEYDLKLKR